MQSTFHDPTSGLVMVPQKCQQQQKGGTPKIDPTPPPVRESNRQVAKEGETERAAAVTRDGYQSTLIFNKKPGNLLGNYDQPGTRSLL